jgi:RNA polymerase sigma-70 factor (ECF subfamily)
MADEKDRPADPEAVLLRRLHSGDPAAVADVYEIYFDRLYSLVFNQVGRRADIAEGIVQGTFLAAMKSAKKSRGQSSVYTWLCSIAYHKVADHYRRQSREHKHIMTGADVDAMNVGDDSGRQPQPESLVNSEPTHQTINLALEEMPWQYRQVLILKYVEGMSVQEIGQIMNLAPKAIEGILTWCRRALQTHLKEVREG